MCRNRKRKILKLTFTTRNNLYIKLSKYNILTEFHSTKKFTYNKHNLIVHKYIY